MSAIGQDWGRTATTELVAALSAVAGELAGRPASDSAAVCMDEVEALGRATDLVETAIAARVRVVDRSGLPQSWGHTSTTAWLRTGLGMRGGRAQERRTMATQLPRLPEVTRRLKTGELSYDHAAVIASAVGKLSDEDCRKAEKILLDLIGAGCGVRELSGVAQRINDVIAERDGRDKPPEDARRGRRSWFRLSSSAEGGTFCRGWFDPELRALIKAKLGPLAKPAGADDPRDHSERMADALAAVLSGGKGGFDPILIIELTDLLGGPSTSGNGSGPGPDQQPGSSAGHRDDTDATPEARGEANTPADHARPGPGSAPHHHEADPFVDHDGPPDPAPDPATDPAPDAATDAPSDPATDTPSDPATDAPFGQIVEDDGAGRDSDEDTAASITAPQEAAAGNRQQAGAGNRAHPARRWPPAPEELRARLADGTPISPQRARQLLISAGFSTLFLGTDGHPLYFGRRSRFASSRQRRVLNARYRACVVDGCDIPAELCEVDHVIGWYPDGTTDVDLLTVCCSFHNKWKAERPGLVDITLQPDGRYRYRCRPPGSRPGSRPPEPPPQPPPQPPPDRPDTAHPDLRA